MRVDDAILAELSALAITDDGLRVTFGKVDCKIYLKINEVLEALGGTWSRKAVADQGNTP